MSPTSGSGCFSGLRFVCNSDKIGCSPRPGCAAMSMGARKVNVHQVNTGRRRVERSAMGRAIGAANHADRGHRYQRIVSAGHDRTRLRTFKTLFLRQKRGSGVRGHGRTQVGHGVKSNGNRRLHSKRSVWGRGCCPDTDTDHPKRGMDAGCKYDATGSTWALKTAASPRNGHSERE